MVCKRTINRTGRFRSGADGRGRIAIIRVLVVTVLSMTVSFASYAQTSQTRQNQPEQTQQQAQQQNVFAPTSAWLVGQASLGGGTSEGEMNLPCVMTNQFGNGFNMRISGTDRAIMAVAVDFRGKFFDKGTVYDLGLRAGGYSKTLHAAALDQATLVMNTQQSAEVYNAIQNAKTLTLRFGQTDLPFSLVGAREGLEHMASCYNNEAAIDEAARGHGFQESRRADAGRNQPKAALSTEQALADRARMPAQPDPTVGKSGYGDPDAAALQPAANKVAPAATPKAAEKDIASGQNGKTAAMLDRYLADAEDSVQVQEDQPQPKDSAGTLARRSFPDEAVERPKIVMDTARIPQNTTRKKPASGSMKWQAQQGASLKDVLNIWTSHKKIGLLWGVEGDYYLPRPFLYEGRFEDALRALFSEFSGAQYAPRGKLYNDMEKGRAFLLVEYVNGG